MRATSVKIKVDFGVGTGRGAGFYRQCTKLADPTTASEEAAAAERARRRAERERAARAAWEARAREEGREERAERAREAARSAQAKAHADRASGGAEARQSAQPTGPRPPRAAVLDLDRQRKPSFVEYEACFQAFRARALREGIFSPADVPLPPRGTAIEPAGSLAEWHRNTKKALLRWHPDKWAALALMLGEAEAEQLKQLIEGMFRAVSRAKNRGFLPQRWAARPD